MVYGACDCTTKTCAAKIPISKKGQTTTIIKVSEETVHVKQPTNLVAGCRRFDGPRQYDDVGVK